MESLQFRNHVRLGSHVLVQFEDGEMAELTIHGRDGDLAAGDISAASPLGRSLLGRLRGERVTCVANGLPQTITLLRVRDSGGLR